MPVDLSQISERALRGIKKKYSSLDKFMQRRTEMMLTRMEKKEQALRKKMQSADSIKARQLFAGTQEKYQQLEGRLSAAVNNPVAGPIRQYVPGLDSIQTAFRFLTQPGAHAAILSPGKLQQLQAASQQIGNAEQRLQQAAEAQQFLKTREHQLQTQLSNYGVGKQLLGINKQAYYAQQQVSEYKAMIQDKRKMEQKVLTTLNAVPAFQGYMQKFSYVGQAFGLPDNYSEAAILNGLQTRVQVQQIISQAVGARTPGSPNGDPAQYVSQQIDAARGQMDNLKNKISALGNSGGSGDLTMPNFSPNDQKTKTFLKRIVLGANIQTQPSSNLLPAMANFGFTIGYKLTGNVMAGVGGAYQLGVGSGWNHIAFSSQGVSLRSFFDIRAKGNWWASGGVEYKYLEGFKKLSDLKKLDLWQPSALVGITRKYKIKGSREGNIQLLFDALYKQHTPSSQPIVFRTGINF